MRPTLEPGDRLLVNRGAYRQTPPIVGEIVVLNDPDQPDRILIKRVALVGPDSAWILRNGFRSSFRSGEPPPLDSIERLEVEAGTLLVLSDRLARSRDSRRFGPVSFSAILGRAYFRYAPVARKGPL